jgi:hypothetical protein
MPTGGQPVAVEHAKIVAPDARSAGIRLRREELSGRDRAPGFVRPSPQRRELGEIHVATQPDHLLAGARFDDPRRHPLQRGPRWSRHDPLEPALGSGGVDQLANAGEQLVERLDAHRSADPLFSAQEVCQQRELAPLRVPKEQGRPPSAEGPFGDLCDL